MSLIQQIANDLVSSLKAKNQEKTSVLRMVKSALKNKAVAEKMPETELSDEQVIAVLRQEVKKRKESAEAFEKGGRAELAEKEQAEQQLLESYLPAQMSADEIKNIIQSVVDEEGIQKPYNLGQIMGPVMKKIAGRADGQEVRKAVQAFVEA